MFTFVGGPYTPKLTTITAATMNYLRGTAIPNALDIIDGGTYTPVTKTILTGAVGLQTNFSAVGLQINGLGGLHVLTGSTAYIHAGGFFVNNGTQTLNGATVYNGGVTFHSTVTVSATGAITVNAASTTTFNGPLAQVGAATFTAGAIFNGALTANGAVSIGAAGSLTTNAAATSTFNGPVVANGALSTSATGTITTNSASTSTFNGPIVAANTVTLTATQPASTADPGANGVYSTHIAKSWCTITTDGGGGATVSDGLNVASVAVAATKVTITFARAFANANYAPCMHGTGSVLAFIVGAFGIRTTTTLEIFLWDVLGAAAINPSTQIVTFAVSVFGRH